MSNEENEPDVAEAPEPEDSRTETVGSSTQPVGSPSDSPGTPDDASGTPDDASGTPDDSAGTPDDLPGTAEEGEKPEADEAASPEETPDGPAELDPDDPESGLVAAGDASDLPDVTSDEALEAALEALLLVIDSPASEETLAETVEQPVSRVTVALRTMAQKFTERSSGIDLRRVGEGWRFYTRDVYAPFVEKLLLDGQRSKLTRAALESLAVIAYRQPVTRARVAAVRGVNVDGVIRTLLARGLIEEMGTDPETTGTLYVTTELFLERLGLSSLADLPPIAPLLPEVDTIDDI
ncbi:SMC-Scp complex subunit ScpB [Amycolatopsis sp. NPDC059021]|uniref:SMC-Scp complex subunit ScpB n=1 Tax=Amycolatopsis sp. NPDC059021 TaxID=3346704 RepID=UPI00366D1C59